MACEAKNVVIWCSHEKEEMNFAKQDFSAIDGGTYFLLYYITSDNCWNLKQCFVIIKVIYALHKKCRK